ncbi:unnamed protein product [Musa textilis]
MCESSSSSLSFANISKRFHNVAEENYSSTLCPVAYYTNEWTRQEMLSTMYKKDKVGVVSCSLLNFDPNKH